ncbi:hypothetical protein R3P38DRAFT_2818553 [Favolaschia claudopus]|uniref:Uncharacterized protein n=1 Tax=Favolaschia claudopus TaxID=2862362 RepID=A0AAW0ECL5_9AGAR
MRFPSPSFRGKPIFPRARLKPSSTPVSSLGRLTSTPLAILRDILEVLERSSDAFPPLKSAVGGVIAIWEITERAKRTKDEILKISSRASDIVELIRKVYPDPSARIPDNMRRRIEEFDATLTEIRSQLDDIILNHSRVWPLVSRGNKALLQDIKARLDTEFNDFVALSTLCIEARQAEILMQQTQLAEQQAAASTQLAHVLLYSKLTFFWPAPGPPMPGWFDTAKISASGCRTRK